MTTSETLAAYQRARKRARRCPTLWLRWRERRLHRRVSPGLAGQAPLDDVELVRLAALHRELHARRRPPARPLLFSPR